MMNPMLAFAACALALVLSPSSASAQAASEPQAQAASPSLEAAPLVEKSPEELAIETKALALREALVRMQDELVAAWPNGDSEAIIAPYRPQANELADAIEAFLTTRAGAMADPEARQAATTEAVEAAGKIRSLPDGIARTVLEALANPKPAPTPPAG